MAKYRIIEITKYGSVYNKFYIKYRFMGLWLWYKDANSIADLIFKREKEYGSLEHAQEEIKKLNFQPKIKVHNVD